MAPLTTKRRNALPDSEFAGPGRSYPTDTPNRARNALSRVSQFGSPALKARIRGKVHSKYPSMGKKKSPGQSIMRAHKARQKKEQT